MTKQKNIVLATLIASIVLVATHQGEFWPFSIFPMFSQAGKPWSRGIIENVTSDTSRADLWETKPISEIENRIVPLHKYGIHEIDIANYISKTKVWDKEKLDGLRTTFKIDQYPGQIWMATRVIGHLNEDNSLVIEAIPMFLYSADTTIKNPIIFSDTSQ